MFHRGPTFSFIDNFTNNPATILGSGNYYPTFYSWGNRRLERLSSVPKSTLVRAKARTWNPVWLLCTSLLNSLLPVWILTLPYVPASQVTRISPAWHPSLALCHGCTLEKLPGKSLSFSEVNLQEIEYTHSSMSLEDTGGWEDQGLSTGCPSPDLLAHIWLY